MCVVGILSVVPWAVMEVKSISLIKVLGKVLVELMSVGVSERNVTLSVLVFCDTRVVLYVVAIMFVMVAVGCELSVW
jgi:hypothetical protein